MIRGDKLNLPWGRAAAAVDVAAVAVETVMRAVVVVGNHSSRTTCVGCCHRNWEAGRIVVAAVVVAVACVGMVPRTVAAAANRGDSQQREPYPPCALPACHHRQVSPSCHCASCGSCSCRHRFVSLMTPQVT